MEEENGRLIRAAMQVQRRSKVVQASQAIASVSPGSKVAVGGLELCNRPMLLVREFVRRSIKRLTLLSTPCGSIDIELLVGSGLVRELIVPRVSLGPIGLAPATARAIAGGKMLAHVVDSASLIAGYRAAAAGQPAAAVPGSAAGDGRKDSRLLRDFTGPSGQVEQAIRAMVPDVALLHVQECDEYGNARQLGGAAYDLLLARASRRVVLQTDRIVTPEEVQGDPGTITISGNLVDAVVQAPYAAHPTASTLSYLQDDKALWEYAAVAVTEEGFAGYVKEMIRGVATQREYLAKLPSGRLEALEQWWEQAGYEQAQGWGEDGGYYI